MRLSKAGQVLLLGASLLQTQSPAPAQSVVARYPSCSWQFVYDVQTKIESEFEKGYRRLNRRVSNGDYPSRFSPALLASLSWAIPVGKNWGTPWVALGKTREAAEIQLVQVKLEKRGSPARPFSIATLLGSERNAVSGIVSFAGVGLGRALAVGLVKSDGFTYRETGHESFLTTRLDGLEACVRHLAALSVDSKATKEAKDRALDCLPKYVTPMSSLDHESISQSDPDFALLVRCDSAGGRWSSVRPPPEEVCEAARARSALKLFLKEQVGLVANALARSMIHFACLSMDHFQARGL